MSRARRAIALLLVIVYAAVIFGSSSRPAPETITDLQIPDFFLHMVEYGGLAFLLSRWIWLQFGRRGLLALVFIPALIASLYGITDEIHQGFVAERDGSARDVLADVLGSLLGAGVYAVFVGVLARRRAAVALVLLLFAAPVASAEDDPVALAANAITVEDLRATASFLASPELGGRDTPSRGIDVAARYLALRFRSFGLEPGTKEGGWFQEVPLTFRVDTGRSFVRVLGERSTRTFDGEHVALSPGSPDGRGAGPVCFAGYGIVAPDAKWDDYAGLDVTGRVVVVFVGSPGLRDRKHPLATSRAARSQASVKAKARLAAARGAVAMLAVTSPRDKTVDRIRLLDGTWLEGKLEKTDTGYRLRRRVWRREYLTPAELSRLVLGDGREVEPDPRWTNLIEVAIRAEIHEVPEHRVAWVKENVTPLPFRSDARRLLRDGKKPMDGIPVLTVSSDLAEALLGKKIGELARGAWEGKASFERKGDAAVVHVRTDIKTSTTKNVVARWPGRDRADEAVVLLAHYDHVGTGASGEVYAGADDNASGTAVILATAKAFTELPRPPSRPVYFVAVAGEERGFIGSGAFVRAPPISLDDMLVAVNLDMVGRGPADEIGVMIGPLGTNLPDVFRRSHAAAGMRPAYQVLPPVDGKIPPLTGRAKLSVAVPRTGYFGRSDQVVFYRKGIPAAFLFGGLHADYHRPSDTPDKLNFARMKRVGHFVLRVARDLAENGLDRTEPGAGR